MRLIAAFALILSTASGALGVERAKAPAEAGVKLEPVMITGQDGWKLAAFYAAPAKSARKGKCPAVILTHMLNRTRQDWKPLVPKLVGAGFAVVAYDMRGHGKSTDSNGKASSWKRFGAADWLNAEKDIARVKAWLLKDKKADVDPRRIALAGGSIGANLSLRALTADPDLCGAVLLSAGLDYMKVTTRDAAGKLGRDQRVAIFATSKDYRGYCARTAAALAKAAGDQKLIVKKVYDGKDHGTAMFGQVKGVEKDILEALQKIVAPKKAKGHRGKDVKDALDRVL